MEFGFMAFAEATTVILSGVVEALVPIAARSEPQAAVGLKAALRGARTLDTVLGRVDVDGTELDRESARTVAKGLSDSLLEARASIGGLTPSTQRALQSAYECARAVHRALASAGSSELMGARVLAHGLDTASTLAGLLTLELGDPDSGNVDCDKARRLTLSLARARDLAADASLRALAVELDIARSLALSLATTPQAGTGGMPLWIFFALGRALGRLDAALERSTIPGQSPPPPEESLVLLLDVAIEASHAPVVEAATKLCVALGELHVARGGCSLLPARRPEPRKGEPGRLELDFRLVGSEGGARGCKAWMVQQIRRMYLRESAEAKQTEGLRARRLKSKTWTPLKPDVVAAEVCDHLEWQAFHNEQAHIASRLEERTLGDVSPAADAVDDGRSTWSAPAHRVVAAMLSLDRFGISSALQVEAEVAGH